MKLCAYTIVATILLLTPVFLVRAQTPCGNVVIPTDFYGEGFEAQITPIQNCDNPLNTDANVSFTASFTLHGEAVTESKVFEVAAGSTTIDLTFEMSPRSFSSPLDIYRREGQDYILNYVSNNNKPDPTPVSLPPGKYTAAFVYTEPPIINQATPTLLEKVFAFLLPTTHAYYLSFQEIKIVNFEIVEIVPEPTGASSVLFLPGIMGSRLYEESDICEDSFTEQERWISRSDCSQLRLVTDFLGNSINEIYTKDERAAVIDETFGLNLYKTFFSSLASWKNEQIIEDYAIIPYDWRLRLDDLLTASLNSGTGKITLNTSGTVRDGYLYKKLEELIADSKSGKVTIVAHSNGGLLTKALLATLQQNNDPLLEKIDNVILVAVPQVGTPGAVLGILQGDEIGPGGLVVSQQTTRRLMNTMPFAFHLLPNSSYFNGPGITVESPVIRFSNGTITTPWANTFGETITNVDSLHNFMQKESGRAMPAWDDLLTPAVVDKVLFTYTRSIEQLQKNWQPGTSTMVYQIAGVGIETPTTLIYFTDQECAARSPLSLYRCTSYQPKLGYNVEQTIDGDGTVVAPSALAMSESDENVKRLWVNLDTYNRSGVLGSNINRVHKDILEVPELIDFIQEIVQGTSTKSYEYISTAVPQFTETDRTTFSLHSPLDMSLEISGGKIISSSTPYIDGAVYRRYGELQYISVPDSSARKKLKLTGESTGSFTLEVKRINGDNETKQLYSAIPFHLQRARW